MNKELLDKIKRAMTQNFVGNYIFSIDEENEILEEASRIFRRVCYERGDSLSYLDYDLIFISLVIATKYWDSQSDKFLDNIYKRLLGKQADEEGPKGKAYTQITKLIDHLARHNKIYLLSCYSKKYYATVTSHAFSPIFSIESFFDMCWEIYNKDLDQTFIKNDPVIELIARSLKNKLSNNQKQDDDDIQIGSKIYSFRAGIKGLIIYYPTLTMNLINQIIEAINFKFNSEPLRQDTYIKVLVSNWWNKKEKNFGVSFTKIKDKSQNIAINYSQIKGKYVFKDGCIKVIIPAIRLVDNLNVEPIISIYNSVDLIVSEVLHSYGSGIIMTTKPKEYDLKSLIKSKDIKLKIVIKHGGKEIYNSKDNLYREYIIFKDSKELTNNECLPGIYYLFINDFNKLIQYPSDTSCICNNIYSCNAKNGERIQSRDKVIFFVDETSNRDIFFFANALNDVRYRYNDEEYKVIDGELFVDTSFSINPKEYGIRYNDVIFKLSDYECFVENNRKKYIISSLANIGEKQKISLFKFSDNSIIASTNFIKFNNISVIYDKELYFNDDLGCVIFKTDKYELKQEFSVDDIELGIALGEGEIILNPPILKWKIDNGDWYSRTRSIKTWFKQYHNGSLLEIDVPKSMDYILGLDNVQILKDKPNIHKVGQYLYSIKEKSNKDFYNLFIRFKDKFYLLDVIYLKENFFDNPLTIDSKAKTITWHPEYFIGDNDSRLNLTISNFEGDNRYNERLSNSEKTYQMSNIPDGEYNISIIMTSKNIFSKETFVLFSKNIKLGDERTFKYNNSRFVIRNAMYFERAKASRIKTLYIDKINYLGSNDSGEYFVGYLYLINKKSYKKIYIDYLYNEKGEKIKINPLRIEKRTENTIYLGYGLDIEDNEYFEFDGEFSIDPDDKISIISKKNGVVFKFVDYFEIEVEKNV